MITIDKEKCVGCGACKKHCPAGIILIKQNTAFVHKMFEAQCLNCGHCQSICEFGAITLDGISEPVKEAKKAVAFADLQDLVESNRSIRSFQDTPVEKSKIERILRTLDYTASAKNEQPVKWVVVSTKEKVEEISDFCIAFLKASDENHELLRFIKSVRNPITVSATHLLIAYTEKEAIQPYDDCMIKMSLASLLMHSDGIGSCFLGYLTRLINADAALKEHIGLQEGQQVYSVLGFGYPDNEAYKKVPSRGKAPVRFIE